MSDRNIEWVEALPSDWSIVRLKSAITLRNSRVSEWGADDNYIGLENIESWTGKLLPSGGRDSSDEDDTHTNNSVASVFYSGDVLFGKLRPYLAKAFLATFNGVCTSELIVMSPLANVASKFLLYVLLNPAFIGLVNSTTFGVKMPRANWATIGNIPIPLPPLSEQRVIADFLDRETAKIDVLIAHKQRLLELLAERRQALITHAVTKGLDPNIPMKDSGVEWLGEIPKHWEATKLRYLTESSLQYGSNALAESDDPSLPRYIRITDIQDDGSLRQDIFRSLPEELAEPFILEEGDILFARSGATVGKTLLYQQRWGRSCFAGYLIRVRPNRDIVLPEFIKYFTETAVYWDWVRNSTIQATIQNVSAEKYSDLTISLPSIPVQERIIEYLKREVSQITLLTTVIRNVIELLQERRVSLINEAVTGKIRIME